MSQQTLDTLISKGVEGNKVMRVRVLGGVQQQYFLVFHLPMTLGGSPCHLWTEGAALEAATGQSPEVPCTQPLPSWPHEPGTSGCSARPSMPPCLSARRLLLSWSTCSTCHLSRVLQGIPTATLFSKQSSSLSHLRSCNMVLCG